MATHETPRSADRNIRFYRDMVRLRNSTILPLTALTLVVFFLLLILTNFTSVLDGEAFSGVTWAYVYAFAIFVFVVVVTTLYRRKMDAAEARLRPAGLDETAAHYDDYSTWEHHEEEIEQTVHHIEDLDRKGHGQ